MNDELQCCCFFGHRKIEYPDEVYILVHNIVGDLITNKNINTFLFGSKSEFNYLCYKVVTELKKTHPHIQMIYVRAEFPHIDNSYRTYLLEKYEDTYFPEKMIAAGKASYVERNREMIDRSKFCVIYYNENYSPPKRRNSRRYLTDYQPKSGTKLAYYYAVKKDREIINVFQKQKEY